MNDSTARRADRDAEHIPVDGHQHRHDRWCGHAAVPHDDHVDFLHDGHVHRPCSDHVDELPGCDEPARQLHLPHSAHMHVHQDDCGHEMVTHQDHVDYLHGQHRHAVHQTHYDEH